MTFRAIGLALAAATLVPSPAPAQSVPPGVRPASDGTGFGAAVAVGDGEVFVGEPLNIGRGGVVFVFRRDAAGGWTRAARLVPRRGEPSDHFGAAVATLGNDLLVGATSLDESRGAAFAFRRAADGTWTEAGDLRVRERREGDGFGAAIAMTGDLAFVGAPGRSGERGVVFVFRRDAAGGWQEVATLARDNLSGEAAFGARLAASGDRVAVAAPGNNENAGAVYVFRHDASGEWREEAQLAAPEMGRGFGSAVDLEGDVLVVGAPRAERNAGAVLVYRHDANAGTWVAAATLRPEGTGPQLFGTAVALAGGSLWIGAPFVERLTGALYAYEGSGAAWNRVRVAPTDDVERGDRLGVILAVRGSVAISGIERDDYGAGSAAIYERSGSAWTAAARILNDDDTPDAIVGGEVDCADGMVRAFACGEVDVVSFLPLEDIGAAHGVRLNDVWGWTDPETGTEYALVGRMDGTSFIDLRDPEHPVYLGDLPKTASSPGATWRDIKVYRNHAFIVADGSEDHGMQVFDLTRLRDVARPPVTFTETAHYDRIHSAHNIVIDEETGFAYAVGSGNGGETCGGGLHMIDIRDAAHPRFAGCFAHEGTGRRGTGYTHDAQCVVYHGPDAEHAGREICFAANETALSIADVTDKANPRALSSASYPNVGYTHQGWLTEDQHYFFSNDELDELNGQVPATRTLVWDVSDLDDPVLLKEYFAEFSSTDHNLYVNGRYMYQTNNTAGLRVLDVADPTNPVEVGYFDPLSEGDDVAGFDGTWSNYPFFASGVIVVTSRREGVFIVKRRERAPIP